MGTWASRSARAKARWRAIPPEWLGVGLIVILLAAAGVGAFVVLPSVFGPHPQTVNGAVSVGAAIAYPPSTFWAVAAHTPAIQNSSLANLVNQTPLTYYRFGVQGVSANQSAGVSYSANGTASPIIGTTYAEFVTWCRWIHCHAILMVPGETNDSGAAAGTVRYVEDTLGFRPDYWSIGNEPQGWTHFNVPWPNWRPSDQAFVSPMEYALEVQRFLPAMRAVDPSVHVIGIQSSQGGAAAAGWIQDLVAVNGPNLSAIAYHAYPGGSGPASPRASDFFQSLTRLGQFPNNYPATVAEVKAACPTCNLPVFVDEFNAALPGNYSSFLGSYANAAYLAAAMTGALKVNVSQVAYFGLQGSPPALGLVTPAGVAHPTYTVYSVFFRNLTIHEVLATTVVGGPTGVYAVATKDATRTCLLVVNTNTLNTLRLNLTKSGLPVGDAGLSWQWDPNIASPTAQQFTAGTLPATWLVPPEGILMLSLS